MKLLINQQCENYPIPNLSKMLIFTLTQLPIVLIHGFASDDDRMKFMKSVIENEIPDAFVINCEIGDGYFDSIFWQMSSQVKALHDCISSYKETENGYIGVGHSQGAYLMRALLQQYNHLNPPMLRFISLAGPLAGFYCGNQSKCVGKYLPRPIEKIVFDDEYSNFVQTHLGPSQYWRDPYNLQMFAEKALSLPLLDNIRDYDEQRKINFMSVDKIILFGGPNDGTIQPWQSTHFGVWKEGSDNIVEYFDQREEYQQDSFGLKSMVQQGRVVFEYTDLTHGDYKYNKVFIKERLIPYLYMK